MLLQNIKNIGTCIRQTWNTWQTSQMQNGPCLFTIILKGCLIGNGSTKWPNAGEAIRSKNEYSTSTNFWPILLCTFKPNIRKIRWKLREPIRFEKRLKEGQTYGRWTAWHWISSADNVKNRVKNCLRNYFAANDLKYFFTDQTVLFSIMMRPWEISW